MIREGWPQPETESDGSAATPGAQGEQRSCSLLPSFFLFHAFSFFLCWLFLSFVFSVFCPFSSVFLFLFSRSLFSFSSMFLPSFLFFPFFPLKGRSRKKAEDTTEKHCGRSGRRTKAHGLGTRGCQLSPRLWERRDTAQCRRCRPKGHRARGRVGEGRAPDRARVTRPLHTGRPPGAATRSARLGLAVSPRKARAWSVGHLCTGDPSKAGGISRVRQCSHLWGKCRRLRLEDQTPPPPRAPIATDLQQAALSPAWCLRQADRTRQ